MVQVLLGTLVNHDMQNDHNILSQHSQLNHLSSERRKREGKNTMNQKAKVSLLPHTHRHRWTHLYKKEHLLINNEVNDFRVIMETSQLQVVK